jgi:hypothetical protein
VVLGAIFLMIPARWAAAAEAAPSEQPPGAVEASTAAVQPLPDRTELIAQKLMLREGDNFYYAVGRPDLALRYWGRFGAKFGMRFFGGGAVLGGLFALAVTYAARNEGIMGGYEPGRAGYAVGGLVAAAGVALLIVPSAWDSDPVSPEERARLAHDAAARMAQAQSTPGLSLVPLVDRDGASLALVGRF